MIRKVDKLTQPLSDVDHRNEEPRVAQITVELAPTLSTVPPRRAAASSRPTETAMVRFPPGLHLTFLVHRPAGHERIGLGAACPKRRKFQTLGRPISVGAGGLLDRLAASASGEAPAGRHQPVSPWWSLPSVSSTMRSPGGECRGTQRLPWFGPPCRKSPVRNGKAYRRRWVEINGMPMYYEVSGGGDPALPWEAWTIAPKLSEMWANRKARSRRSS
jgi:hypothetical protein